MSSNSAWAIIKVYLFKKFLKHIFWSSIVKLKITKTGKVYDYNVLLSMFISTAPPHTTLTNPVFVIFLII